MKRLEAIVGELRALGLDERLVECAGRAKFGAMVGASLLTADSMGALASMLVSAKLGALAALEALGSKA